MSKNSTVYDCTIIELDKHHRDEGNITVVENVKTVPFEVKRTDRKSTRLNSSHIL